MQSARSTTTSMERTTRRSALTRFGAIGSAALALAAVPAAARAQDATPTAAGEAGKALVRRFYYEARQFDFWGVADRQLTKLLAVFDVAGFEAQLAAAATPTG